MAWDSYIRAAAEVAQDAGVKIARLNVGGGFPAHRLIDVEPQLDEIFALIDRVTTEAFGDDRPALVCEPGRGLVAECYSAVVCVKAIRDGEHVFMNDGIYGGLAELPLIGVIDRIEVIGADLTPRLAARVPRICFGPTCDSVDRLPGELMLPGDMAEGDYMVFHGMGAYSTATVTRFNGFGNIGLETVYAFKG
jgi:ornithine decarboxylase